MRSEPEGSGADHDRVAEADFDLVRHFSLTCLVLFVIVTTVMCVGFYQISERYIRIDAERRAVPIADWLSRIAFEPGRSFPAPGTAKWADVDRQMRVVLPPLRIFKVKVYDREARIVYSTDSQIPYGQLDPLNEELHDALGGATVSSLQTRDTVWDLADEERRSGAIVEAYVPVRSESGQIVGVMEIYQDVTEAHQRFLPIVILIIVGASVLAMGTLYAILLLYVRRADWTIRTQTLTIRKAKADLEVYAAELEERVRERTRQLRESFLQQQQDAKMVAAGTLAAGVAHELNTPLGTILGSAQMILEHCRHLAGGDPRDSGSRRLPDGCGECIADLSRIESQARRCKQIVGNLVDFSRKSNSERSWEDLADLTEQSLFLVQPNARQRGARIETDIEPDLPPILVNGNEIQQVLVNLIKNGIEAITNGGEVRVRIHSGNGVATIEVSDTGAGMDEATTQRIFEPFFTSKEVGRGTGLGLAISYRIVKEHGGKISVRSAPGMGSTFTVELPTGAEAREAGAVRPGGRPVRGPQRAADTR